MFNPNVRTTILNTLSDKGFLVDYTRDWVGLSTRKVYEPELINALTDEMIDRITYTRDGNGFLLTINEAN